MAWARLCRRCSYRLWQILVTLLVLLALSVSSLRLLSPYAEHIKEPVQEWFLTNYQLKLDYEKLQVEWQHFGLYLTLEDVDIDPIEGDDQVKHLNSLSVRFEPWGSVLSQRIRFGDIRLQGLELEIASNPDLNSDSTSQMTWQQMLRELASNRFEEFELADARLTIGNSSRSQQQLVIPSLVWRNEPFSHKGEGQAHMLGFPEQSVNFIVDIRGNKESPEQIQGQLYLNVEHVSPHPFLRFWMHQAVDIEQSEVNFQAWLDFDWHSLKKAWVALGDNNIRWRHNGLADERSFQLQDGNLIFRSKEAGWQLFTHNVKVQTNDYHWPDVELSMARIGPEVRANVERLDLAGLTPLLEFYPGLSEQFAELANQTSGAIRDLRWQQQDQKEWLLTGRLQDAGWQQTASIPGVEELDGLFELSPHQLVLKAQAGPQSIQPGGQFAEAISLERFETELIAGWSDESWQVNVTKLKLVAAFVEAELSARLEPDLLGNPQLFLYGEAAASDAGEIWRYYPIRPMGKSLTDYLNRSIKEGETQLTQVLWHGAFADFPYANQTGTFHLKVPVQHARMKFDEHWPALDATELVLEFQNQDLFMEAAGAKLLEADIKALKAKIPGLRHSSILTIEGEVETGSQQVRQVINDSMLASTLGETLELLALEGPVSGPLRLDIPLTGKDVKAQGFADLRDGKLMIPGSSEHQLEQVTGRIYFQQEAIQIENLTGRYHQLPVTVSLIGGQEDEFYGVQARLNGAWPIEVLQQHPQIHLPKTEGQLDWQGEVQAQISQQGAEATIKLTSDLNEVSIALPAPMAKPKAESWPMRVDMTLSKGAELNGRAVIGDQLFAMWQQSLGREKSQDDYVWLGVGTQQPLKGTPSGTTMDLELAELDFTPWLELSGNGSGKGPEEGKTLPFEQGTWRIGQAKLHDYLLPKLDIAVRQLEQGWLADISGSEVLAELQYKNLEKPLLQLKARQLTLAKPEQEQDEQEQQGLPTAQPKPYAEQAQLLASIPALDIQCMQCQVDDYFFDELRLVSETNVESGQWRAREAWFRVGSGEVNFEQFAWQLTERASQSQLVGRVKATDFDEMTRGLMPGSEFPVKDSEVEGEFEFIWPGAPFEFKLQQLEGNLSWILGPGHIAEVSDKGARVFTLLSMDSLIRKIRLDFSDVFDNGLFYNAMEGSFVFRDGYVISDPIEMDGVAGDMTIKGRTNLQSQQLDYEVVFNPDLTGSLPLLAGLTINPVTGIYVLALHTVMKPVVEVVTQIRFQVSGTTDDPIVTEVGRSKKEIKVEQPPAPQAEGTATAGQPNPVPLSNEQSDALIEQELAQPLVTEQAPPEEAKFPEAPTEPTPPQSEQQPVEEAQPAELLPELPIVAPISVGEGKKSDDG